MTGTSENISLGTILVNFWRATHESFVGYDPSGGYRGNKQ